MPLVKFVAEKLLNVGSAVATGAIGAGSGIATTGCIGDMVGTGIGRASGKTEEGGVMGVDLRGMGRTGVGVAGAATDGTSTASITRISARLFVSAGNDVGNAVKPGLYTGGAAAAAGAGAGVAGAMGVSALGAPMAMDPAAEGAA